MNEDLIASAVGFLQDPNVSSSPLNKKVEFLQSKGLDEREIEEALNRANGNTTTSVSNTSTPSVASTSPSQVPLDYYNVQPPVPERTWKDYFIMATATAGVTYGLYQVISKYVIPSIVPPTQTSIDEDKAQIDEEFLKIDKLLEELSSEQKEIKQANDDKLKEIDTVIDNVNDFLTKYNKDKLTFDDDLRLMKLEIDNLKNSVEKNLNLTKDNLKGDLSDINEELNSLKNLIKLRSAKENDRKITPVSSIPSASEILKNSKKQSPTNSSPQSPQVMPKQPHQSQPPVQSQSPAPASSTQPQAQPESAHAQTSKPEGVRFSDDTSLGGVTAAGIPEWQMKHKLQEEKKENVVDDTINKVGVPSWQLNQSN